MVSEAQVKAATKRVEDLAAAVEAEEAVVNAVASVATEADARSKVKKLQQLCDRLTFAKLQRHILRMQAAAEPEKPVK